MRGVGWDTLCTGRNIDQILLEILSALVIAIGVDTVVEKLGGSDSAYVLLADCSIPSTCGTVFT
jgi:hypothetical protein